MPGRTYSAQTGYRYGFDGSENDNEIKGEGNSINFRDRVYDARLGRWLSLDPLQKKYPGETPYGFVSGNPILYIDADGRDKIVTITIIGNDGKTRLVKKVYKDEFKYGKDGRMDGGGYYYWKKDIIQNLTIDLRNNETTFSSHTDNIKYIDVYEYSKISDVVNWLDKSIFGNGDANKNVAYGYKIYGNGKDMEWENGLPKAAPGSESIDLGKWFDMIGGMREGMTPGDLATNPNVKKIYEGITKALEIIDKSVDATEYINGDENKKLEDTNRQPKKIDTIWKKTSGQSGAVLKTSSKRDTLTIFYNKKNSKKH